jgi:hypothetical protein
LQTIWFIIAIRKRFHLEKLDKEAALLYLKKRLNSKSQSNDSEDQKNRISKNFINAGKELILNNLNSLESKRTFYSFSKLDDKNPLVKLQKKVGRDSVKTFSSRNQSPHQSVMELDSKFTRLNSINKGCNPHINMATSIEDNELKSGSFITKNSNFVGINNSDETQNKDYQSTDF